MSTESSFGRPSIGTHLLRQWRHHGSASLATESTLDGFRRAMEGTERVFERLVLDHQNRIYALGPALTGNRHDPEEGAQGKFLRAYRAPVTFPHDRVRELKQKARLHRSALHLHRDPVRRVWPR